MQTGPRRMKIQLLLEDLQPDIFEVYNHPGIMKLKLDHTAVQPFALREMLNELSGRLPVQEELEPVALGDHMQFVPSILINVLRVERILERGNGRTVVLIDHEAVPPETTMLPTARGMEIPSSENLASDADMPDVRMIALKLAPSGLVHACANIDSAVPLSRKPIEKL